MPFLRRHRPHPVVVLDRESYRPGDAVRVTVTIPVEAQQQQRPCHGHVRLRCHRPTDAALDAFAAATMVDPPEIASAGGDCVEIARAELMPHGPAGTLEAVIHLPGDAEPTCRGACEVAAWEVVAVVDRRAASAWVEVVARVAHV
jgi:hypothetical protein